MTGRPRGELPTPPREFEDADGREIAIRGLTGDDREPLVEMYLEFEPGDRAQGIPPVEEEAIRDWLDAVTETECLNLVAWHQGHPIGHAMLVAGDPQGYELAIFVAHEYQGAGIGTELLRTLLGLAREHDVDRVWLTVERWNDPAIRVYEKVGFETTDAASFEREMALRLD